MCNNSWWSVFKKNSSCPNCVFFLLFWTHLLEVGSCCQSRHMNCEKMPPVILNPIGAYPLIAKTLCDQKLVWIGQLAKKRLSRCGGMCSQNRRRGHFQGARTGPPSVWGLEEQPPTRLLLGNQEEKILKIQVYKHVLVFPQLWTVTTRAFAIYLSTRRSTWWPHVPTVWLLMSDA